MMIRRFQFSRAAFTTAFMAAIAIVNSHECNAEPRIFRLPADDTNPNSEVIRSVAFSPNGKLLAGAFGVFHGMLQEPRPGQVVLWDVATGRHRAALLGHGDGVKSVAFSPDGALIATAGYLDQIKLWQTESLKLIATIPATAVMTSIAFSPDSKLLAVGLDASGVSPAEEGQAAQENDVELYDVATRNLVRRFKGHTMGVTSVAFSPTGSLLATGSDDGTARLWEVATGRLVASFVDPQLTEVVNDYWQRIAQAIGREISEIEMPPNVESVAFSPDGKRIAIAGGLMVTRERDDGIGRVTLWDVETKQLQGRLQDYDCSVLQVQFSMDGKLLATAGRDGYVRLWHTATLRHAGRFRGFGPVAFSRDGNALVSTTSDPALVLRRIADVIRAAPSEP